MSFMTKRHTTVPKNSLARRNCRSSRCLSEAGRSVYADTSGCPVADPECHRRRARW